MRRLTMSGLGPSENIIASRKSQSQPRSAAEILQVLLKGLRRLRSHGPIPVAGPLMDDPNALYITTEMDGQVYPDENEQLAVRFPVHNILPYSVNDVAERQCHHDGQFVRFVVPVCTSDRSSYARN